MDERDDPARRLHSAISSVLEAADGRDQTGTGGILTSALAAESPARALATLLTLLDDVRSGLRSLVGTHSVESYLVQIEPLDSWLSGLNLTKQWKESGRVDARAHEALLVCSDQLQGARPLRSISEDDLTHLRGEVDSLLNDILLADDVNEDLRRFLIASARAMRDAIDDYGLRGSSHILDVIERAAGAFAIYRPRPKTDEGESLWKRFVAWCGEAIIVMTFVAVVPQLPANLRHAYDTLVQEPPATQQPKAIEAAKPGELQSGSAKTDANPEG